jgi:nucleotide-binding universal stress UspA family protein
VSTVYHQILVPVAEPAEVEPMIRFAATLLEPDGLIRVLHVIPTTTLPEVTREWRSSVHLVVPAHEAGAALDVRVDPEVRAATDVPGEILESAEAHSVDAILLTLRGSRSSRNPFVGHTATGILHHAHASVLVLNRLAMASERVARILVPTFRPTPSPTTMRLAEEISVKSGGAPVVALVLGSRDEGGPQGSEDVSARGISITRRHALVPASILGRRRRLPELILQAAARERYGFLLVGEESSGGVGGPLLTRRFLEELFRAAPCPVLAIRD